MAVRMGRYGSTKAVKVALGGRGTKNLPLSTKLGNTGTRLSYQGRSTQLYLHPTTAPLLSTRVFSQNICAGRVQLKSLLRLRTFSGGVTGASNQSTSFEEDCAVVEECSALINARMDVPS